MKLGSDEHKKKVAEDFCQTFDRMTELLKVARSVEIQLKLYFDINEHIQNLKVQSYEKFAKSKFTASKPKINRLINKISEKGDAKRLQAVRLFADPLAHADYLKARTQLEDYKENFAPNEAFSVEPFSERLAHNIADENGENCDYANLITSSDQNTIVAEFLVFEHQGYANFAMSILKETSINFDIPSMSWSHEILMMSKTIKPQNKVSKT